MHVLIVTPVFPPEPVTSSVTSYHLATGLAEVGHQVTVITSFPNRPEGKLYVGQHRKFFKVEKDGARYTLIRSFSTLSPKPKLASRLVENLSFGMTSAINALPLKPDIVYANTWPIFAAGLTTLFCSLRSLPLVLNIQDIYPEAAVQLGKLPGYGPIPRILKYIDGLIANRAAALILLSEGFAKFYGSVRKVPEDQIHIVYNWMDGNEIKPGPRLGKVRKTLGISEDMFVIMYAGNVGAVADVQTIVKSMSILRDLKNFEKIALVIAGDGSHRLGCEALAKNYGLSNVHFFYPLRRVQVSDVQAAADLMVLPTRKSGSLTSVPSKLIAYMLSGRPVLAAVERASDTARIIRDSQCGVCIDPEDPNSMAIQLRRLMQMPEELVQMGQKARYFAEQYFTRNACVPKIINILESVSNTKHVPNLRGTWE